MRTSAAGYDFHPVAALWPLPSPAEIDRLAASIRRDGQRVPAALHHGSGLLVDGRSRAIACESIGRDLRVAPVDGDPFEIASSLNGDRRDMDTSRRSMVAARSVIGGFVQAAGGARARTIAARRQGVSPRAVGDAITVIRRGGPELAAAVDAGELSVSAAAALAKGKIAREALTSSRSDEWYTEPVIVEGFREAFGGRIAVDPASCPEANTVVQAEHWIGLPRDGAAEPWPDGPALCNPPYSRDSAAPFTTRISAEGRAGRECGLITKLAPDCEWFRPVWTADALALPERRVKFWGPRAGHGPTFAACLSYWGPDVEAFAAAFSHWCRIVRLSDMSIRP